MKKVINIFLWTVFVFFGLAFTVAPITYIVGLFLNSPVIHFWDMIGIMTISGLMCYIFENTLEK